MYLTVKCTYSLNYYKRTSSFLTEKIFHSVFRDDCSLKKLHSEDRLFEVSSVNQSQLHFNCNIIGPFSASVKAHQTLNACRGVISELDMSLITKEEMLQNLNDQKVLDISRVTLCRNGQMFLTKHVIVTFSSSILPSRFKANYLNCPVWLVSLTFSAVSNINDIAYQHFLSWFCYLFTLFKSRP